MDKNKAEAGQLKHWYPLVVRGLAAIVVAYIAYLMAISHPKGDQLATRDKPRKDEPVEEWARRRRLATGSPQQQQIERVPHGKPVASASADDATTRKFIDASRCVHARRVSMSLRRQLDVCSASEKYAEYFAACSKRTEHYGEDIARLESESAGCETNETLAEDEYFDAVLKAAIAGNADARICFVDSSFNLSIPWSSQGREQYQTLAKTYVDSALEGGDWRVVQLLVETSRGLGNREILRSVTNGDALHVYRMNRLLRQGATGDYANKLDILGKDSGASLAASDAREAEDWALNTYRRYFTASPPLTTDPTPCLASSSAP